MRITLTGIRCYKEPTTFECEDIGTILISGPSGVGKSTILMGINFALYGVGGKNICSYGETKCKVEFTFKDLKIVRTKSPNRLVVNDTYEDQVAQQIIYDFFGKNFNVTGYISQNTTESFLNKSAIAKREFLETVKFESLHLAEKKDKLDALIKANRQELDRTIGKLELAKSQLMEKPALVKFPLKKTSNIDMTISNEKMKAKNCETSIKNSTHKIKKKEEALNQLRVAMSYLSAKDDNINQICSQLTNLRLEMDSNNDFIGEEQLSWYQNKLKVIKENTQRLRLVSQRNADQLKLTTMRETELKELNRVVDSIQNQLWVDYSKEDTLSLIQNNEDVLKDIAEVNLLKSRKSKLKDLDLLETTRDSVTEAIEKTKMELQSLDVMSCPKCDSKLLLEGKVLIPCDDAVTTTTTKNKASLSKELQTLSSQLKQLEFDILQHQDLVEKNTILDTKIQSILSQYEDELNEEELKEDLKQMLAYNKSQLTLETKLRDYQGKINNQLFSPSYQAFKKEVEKLNKQLSLLDDEGEEVDDEIDEETIRDIIQTNQQKHQKIQQIKKQIVYQEELQNKLLTQKEEYKSQMNHHEDESTLVHDIQQLKSEIVGKDAEWTEHKENLNKIDAYLEYKKLEATYNKQMDMILALEKQEQNDSSRYTLAKIVKQELLEVEHIALSNIINDINANANVYLQEFFEEPIFVNLSCFKEDKKKNDKPQINIDVKYKDKSCELSSLSGGEYARVNLAFTLSLAEIFHTPLLLLDETMSSLDEDAADTVFSSIKKHFKTIPVISILHQVTSEGDFDQVIKL